MKKIKPLISFLLLFLLLIGTSVPVSADNFLSNYPYIAQDSYGIVYLSQSPLSFLSISVSVNSPTLIGIGVKPSTAYESFIVLIPRYENDKTIYEIRYSDYSNVGELQIDLPSYSISDSISVSNLYLYGSSLTYGKVFVNLLLYFGSVAYNSVVSNYSISANYTPLYQYNGYPSSYYVDPANFKVDPDLSLSDLIGGSTFDSQGIIDAINGILNAGQGNSIPQGGGDLAAAEDKLSSAEDAVIGKSESLVSSVASTWSDNITISKNFAQSLTATSVEVNNAITQILESVPGEVKAMFIAIPLLIFIAWIIGRIS